MTDLTERLRRKRERQHDLSGVYYTDDMDCQEAADEIDRLRAERDDARADIVAFSEMAAQLVEDMSRKPSTTWGQVKAAMRALGDLGDRRALRAKIDAAVRAERERVVHFFLNAMRCRSCGVVFDSSLSNPHDDQDCQKNYANWGVAEPEQIAAAIRERGK